MKKKQACPIVDEKDLRDALREMKTYVDISEDDLTQIYQIAIRHAQERLSSQVPVSDVMTKRVVAVKRNVDLHEAARILSEHRISGMPVVDDHNRVIGVITEADLLMLAGMNKGHTFKDIVSTVIGEPVTARKGGNLVENVMSFPALTITAVDTIRSAAGILDERKVKRLPVVDREGRLIGIISRGDIVKSISKKG